MSLKEVQTSVGVINGRNGIYLDEIAETFGPSTLSFKGDINGNLCSKNDNQKRWIPYRLKFLNVIAYECQGLDFCYWEKSTRSCFDESTEPFFEGDTDYGDQYRYFYLSTYDYMFKIVAKNYEMDVNLD